MSTAAKGLLQNIYKPQLQFVRFRGKVNITKPRPPHFKRAIVETVCLPYFTEKKRERHVPRYDLCSSRLNAVEEKPDHPMELILARESLNWFKKSRMIAFYHLNTMTDDEKFQNQLTVKKNGMKLCFFRKDILGKALKGSIFEPLMKLYRGPTATAFSPEVNINILLNISKKLPKLILMAAVVDDRLLSYSELQHCRRFENITDAQSHLVSSINMAPQNLLQHINHSQSNLVGLLNEHQKNLKGGKDS